MNKVYLFDVASGKHLHNVPFNQDKQEGVILVVTDIGHEHGRWKAITVNNDTATLVIPSASGAIQLTDIIVSSEKQVGATVTVQFNDGSNSEIIMSAQADSPIQLATSFAGRWSGWKDAYVEVIVGAAFDATVALGYIKLDPNDTLGYAAWDALR